MESGTGSVRHITRQLLDRGEEDKGRLWGLTKNPLRRTHRPGRQDAGALQHRVAQGSIRNQEQGLVTHLVRGVHIRAALGQRRHTCVVSPEAGEQERRLSVLPQMKGGV